MTTQQPAVLSQACRALSALALLPVNRTRIAKANGVAIIVSLLSQVWSPSADADQKLFVTELVQECALAACTNIVHSSEANRQLVSELGGINSMVTCALFARDGICVQNAAQAIANVAYESYFAASMCMAARADVAICSAINAVDVLLENSLLEAA